MGRILEDVEIELLRRVAAKKEAAVRQAAKEIEKDFKKKVFDQAVSDYYGDYAPQRYRRTGGLRKAFKVKAPTDGRRIEIDYKWNHNWLPGYKSNSEYHQSGGTWISRYDDDFDYDSGDNGKPEKGWIFGNFMEGIHPIFSYDKELGIYLDNSLQFEPSYIRIREYKEKYIESGAMKSILLKNLKKQCRKL